MEDVLLMSLAVTCDQQTAPSDLRYTLTCCRIKHWCPSVYPCLHGHSRYEQIPNVSFRLHYAILL